MSNAERPTSYDLSRFTLREMTLCGQAMRRLAAGATSMEEVAGRIVRHLHENVVDERGARACALVRFFKTHRYDALDAELEAFARSAMAGVAPVPAMRCLTLIGTAGDEPAWNSRRASTGHQAIPLPSEAAVQAIPMLRQLIAQLGLSVSMVVRPDPELLLDVERSTFNVFLVPDARGSPYIPAQEAFVVPHHIRSVLGFGGLIPSGEVFIVIMFLRVAISRETADLFKNLSLNVKLAVLPFELAVFAGGAGEPRGDAR